MKLKSLINKPEIHLIKNKLYEVEEIVQDTYKIKIPMKQKGKFRYALVKEDEGELVDDLSNWPKGNGCNCPDY